MSLTLSLNTNPLVNRFAEPDDLVVLAELIGADPSLCNFQDDLGRTPLHMAAANGHANVMEVLLGAKPAVNVQNHEGNTALHYCAMHNHLECARLLLNAGWKVSVRNKYGRTALREIGERQFDEMEVLLLKFDEELDSYENSAATIDAPDEGDVGFQQSPPAPAPVVMAPVPIISEGAALDEVE